MHIGVPLLAHTQPLHPVKPRQGALHHLLLEEFAAELARRGAAEAPAEDMSTMELALEAQAEALKRASLARRLERRSGEDDDNPKQCPRRGEQVPVKVKKRPRQVRTLSGLQVLRRNYHYCKDCQAGFYPLVYTETAE